LYGQKVTPQDIMANKVAMPAEANQLIQGLQSSQAAAK
jgi:lipid-binding SYLF domain-containing protein